MAATAESIAACEPAGIDHHVLLRHATWADYERLLELRGESAVPRLTFLDGVLELMTPSGIHETDKTRIGRLLEAWADESGIQLEGVGSWTIRSEEAERGAEPDECYFVGPIPDDAQRPDIAIEVVRTSGGIDKLEVWRGLGVPEVWFWQDRRLRFFRLREGGYRELERSRALPDLDPALVLEAMAAPSQTEAVRLSRERMRG